jgi:AsmA-like C-terminal region
MSAGILRSCIAGARYCVSGLVTVFIWTLWLGLLVLLVFQAYIASVNELEVPRFLLHAIEDHLAESGVSVEFGRAIFDPSGRILLQKARFRLSTFSEPIVTANAIYIRLDPWALLERRFEPKEIRATGTDLFIPAMLSPSGRAEKIVEDLDAGFSIASRGDEFSVDYLNCRLGSVALSAHGTINAGTVARNSTGTSLPLTEFVSKNYVALSREFSGAEERLLAIDQGVVTAVLTPSDTRGAIVNAELCAAGLRMTDPLAVTATRIRATARFPLLGGAPLMASAFAYADALQVAGQNASNVRARIRGILSVDTLKFSPREFEVTAGSASGYGAEAVAPIARVFSDGATRIAADVSALAYGSPVSGRADLDLATKSAAITFDALVSPGLITPASNRTGFAIRRYADLSQPVALIGSVHLGPGWKFVDGAAHLDGRNVQAYGVRLDEVRGDISFDGTHLAARHAVAVTGVNQAMGSYEMSFPDLHFRYLLKGRLRPLDISPWFHGGWWEGIFSGFGFPSGGPDANVDVHGVYQRGRLFSVFGYADTKSPVVMGVPFDRLRTLMYIDQSVCEGFEVQATKGPDSAQASFKAAFEPATGIWNSLDIDVDSALDPTSIVKILPAGATSAVEAFSFDHAPSIALHGHFDGPSAPAPRHKDIHTEVRSDAPLRVHGVAFSRARFTFDVKDDDIDVSDVEAGFAGGVATGKATLAGEGAARRLRFKAALDHASLGLAASAAEGYVVTKATKGSTALDTFAREKSDVLLDLNVSAEGQPGELGTFTGDGNVQIQGGELGALSLLGGLSRVLTVTELRFTQARAEFTIADSSLVFPDVTVIGANSAIQAKGTYSISEHVLNFSARVYPFQESKSLLQVLHAISAPLFAVFTVKLSGTIDKPSWSLRPFYTPGSPPRGADAKAGESEPPSVPSPLANPTP